MNINDIRKRLRNYCKSSNLNGNDVVSEIGLTTSAYFIIAINAVLKGTVVQEEWFAKVGMTVNDFYKKIQDFLDNTC